jgi:hypothetical protein
VSEIKRNPAEKNLTEKLFLKFESEINKEIKKRLQKRNKKVSRQALKRKKV